MAPMPLDQANTLRAWSKGVSDSGGSGGGGAHRHLPMLQSRDTPPQVIAVASGKGGVGRTSLVANLAIAFARSGLRVLALDGDLALANLDIALGVVAPRSISDVVDGIAPIEDVLTAGPQGVWLLPACSGRYDLTNLSERARYNLFSAIDTLEQRFDLLLIDTAAGIGANSIAFAGAAQRVVILTNSEPTSLADAYAFIKVLSNRCDINRVSVVVNAVKTPREGEEVYACLANLSDRFLGVGLEYLGSICHDYMVSRAIRAGVPLLLHAPDAPASHCISTIAERLRKPADANGNGIRLFWRQLLTWSTVA